VSGNRAHIDFETRNYLNLRRCGVHRYCEHPSMGVWCMCFRIEDEARRILAEGSWRPGQSDPVALLTHIAAGLTVVAHNNAFDRTVWNRYVRVRLCPHWPEWTIEQSDCTVARAAVIAVPQGLEFVAPVLGIDQRKDDVGSRLMRKMMVPRTTTMCTCCNGTGHV
jgi:hypothetical protein